MTEQEARLTLNAIPGVGNVTIRDLVQYYGSADKVFTLTKQELLASGLSEALAVKIIEFERDKFLKNEYNLIKQNKVEVLTLSDDGYPAILKEIPDAPAVLYTKGNLALLKNIAIAMVGSRQSSVSGLNIAEKFAGRLSECGISIVSGMARGIDTAAHRGCLKAGGITIAVVGCGLEKVYPPENKELFAQIAQRGAILSEFPMQMLPLPHNFPRRNRIISGLSLGVIIVEAALRSGALVTARMALEQGREVFAVPGPIDRPSAQGVNELIKQGAKLITSIEDVLEELKPALRNSLERHPEPTNVGVPMGTIPASSSATSGSASGGKIESSKESRIEGSQQTRFFGPNGPQNDGQESPVIGLTQEEQSIFDRIANEPVHVDELLEIERSAGQNTMSVLLQLELKHLIRQLPGKRFVRLD